MQKTGEDRRTKDGSEVKKNMIMLLCSPVAEGFVLVQRPARRVGALSLFALSQRGNNNQGGEREGRSFEFSSPAIQDIPR